MAISGIAMVSEPAKAGFFYPADFRGFVSQIFADFFK